MMSGNGNAVRLQAKMLSFYNHLKYRRDHFFFEVLSLFFQKKSVCPAIKWKWDALIEMNTLWKTPRNAARKSCDAGGRWKRAGGPEDHMAGMRLERAGSLKQVFSRQQHKP